MPWEMDEFVRERVERARRLLEESEAHRGTPDLQARGRRRGEAAIAAMGAFELERRMFCSQG